MDWDTLFPEMVKWVLGGGLSAAVTLVLLTRRQARKIEGEESRAQAKLPAEIDSLIINGAEKTISLMAATNDRLVAEVNRKSEELAYKDNEIMGLRTRVREQGDTIAGQQSELISLRDQVAALGAQLVAANEAVHTALVQLAEANRAYTAASQQLDARPSLPEE